MTQPILFYFLLVDSAPETVVFKLVLLFLLVVLNKCELLEACFIYFITIIYFMVLGTRKSMIFKRDFLLDTFSMMEIIKWAMDCV